jgi:isoleucyl-tRNA synthetase
MDKWLLSRLNTLVKTVDDNLSNYKVTETAKVLQGFVDEMSNWYVRRSRERFWAKELTQDKINAYMTLYTALVTVAKAAAPMVPFMTEDMYQNLVCGIDAAAPESIHLCDFPTVNEQWIDKELETNMELVLEIVVLGRSARNTANIKNRQPIGNMYVKAADELNDFYKKIVEEELNVKAVTFKDDMEEYLTYSFKPQFKVLGPKVGKQIGEIKAALVTVNGHEAKEELDKTGELKLTLKTGEVTLLAEDMEVSMAQTEGYVSDRYNGVIVALETTLSQELLEEGFVREVISKLQTMRKDNKFEVMDRIDVYVNGNEKIAKLMTANMATIKDIVLGNEIHVGSLAGFTKEWNINGEKVELGIQ